VTTEPPRVGALFRYPVKSMLGESPAELAVDARGVAGDRWHAVLDPDGKLGSGKSSPRFRRMEGLLRCSARYAAGEALVRLPDGRELPALGPDTAAALSELVGRPVTVGTERAVKHLDGPAVHLVSTAALRWLGDLLPDAEIEPARFRPNLLLGVPGAGQPEQSWAGREIEIGEVRLAVTDPTPRCVMVSMEQGELPEDRRVLRTLTEAAGGAFGVGAEVLRPGTIRVGDPVRVR
jgi:uncharacterized protein YcbX